MTAQHPHMDRRAAHTNTTHARGVRGGRERKRMHVPAQERAKFLCVNVA